MSPGLEEDFSLPKTVRVVSSNNTWAHGPRFFKLLDYLTWISESLKKNSICFFRKVYFPWGFRVHHESPAHAATLCAMHQVLKIPKEGMEPMESWNGLRVRTNIAGFSMNLLEMQADFGFIHHYSSYESGKIYIYHICNI